MRTSLVLLPLLMTAAPAAAQAQAAPPPALPPAAEMQQRLADPALADKLANVMQALSRAFLDLPVGEVQAAVEGRAPTAAERKLTVRSVARRDDPNFERNLQRQVAQAKPMIQHSMRALAETLPVMMKSMNEAAKSLERAAANMPDPTYPKR